jgi:hypothetical protein
MAIEDELITLVVPGADAASYPISHGDKNWLAYREDPRNPQSKWLVSVPRHAAVHFLHNGGFALYEKGS